MCRPPFSLGHRKLRDQKAAPSFFSSEKAGHVASLPNFPVRDAFPVFAVPSKTWTLAELGVSFSTSGIVAHFPSFTFL